MMPRQGLMMSASNLTAVNMNTDLPALDPAYFDRPTLEKLEPTSVSTHPPRFLLLLFLLFLLLLSRPRKRRESPPALLLLLGQSSPFGLAQREGASADAKSETKECKLLKVFLFCSSQVFFFFGGGGELTTEN